MQSANGYDIVFTSDAAGQNQLDHEIDNYNPATGQAGFWVRIPTLSHTMDTQIYMWYGNSAVVASQENKAGVWKNRFVAVYHFGASSAIAAVDSTGKHNGSMGGVGLVSGRVGGAADLSGSQFIRVPDSDELKPTTSLTLEAWVAPATNNNCMGIIGKDFR